MSSKHKPIHLHIYKSQKGINGIATGENGKILNENQSVKMIHNTFEWTHWLTHIVRNGIIKIDVKGFWVNDKYEQVPESVKEEISLALRGGEPEKELSQDQKRILALEAKLESLVENNTNGKDNTPEVNEELETARAEYKEVFGKEAHPNSKLGTINNKIKAELNK